MTVPRTFAVATLAAAVLFSSRCAAGERLCGSGSGQRPVTDTAASGPTAVSVAGLTGGCYPHGLAVALPESAGNVTVGDAWVEGSGVQVTAVPTGAALSIVACRVTPTSLVPKSGLTAAVLLQVGDAKFMGALRMVDTDVTVVAAAQAIEGVLKPWMTTAVAVENSIMGKRAVNVTIVRGSLSVDLTSIHGGAVATEGPVSLSVSAGPRSAIALLVRNQVTVRVTDGRASGIRPFGDVRIPVTIDVRDVDLRVECDGCDADGVAVMSVTGVALAVRDSSVSVTGPSGHAIKMIPAASALVERCTVTGASREGARRDPLIECTACDNVVVADSVLSTTGQADGALIKVQYKNLTLARTVLRGGNASAMSIAGVSHMATLVDVDVEPASPAEICVVAQAGAESDMPAPLAARGLRCALSTEGGPAALTPVSADVAVHRQPLSKAPVEAACPGYLVGASPVVSMSPALPPFRFADLGSMCRIAADGVPAADQKMLNLPLTLSGIAANATVTVPGVTLGSLTISGGVPAGARLVLNGTRLGPLAGTPAGAVPALRVTGGPVLGTVVLTGGATVRGGVQVAGDFGAGAVLELDGAAVEAGGAAVHFAGAMAGEVRILRASIAGPATLSGPQVAAWLSECRLKATGGLAQQLSPDVSRALRSCAASPTSVNSSARFSLGGIGPLSLLSVAVAMLMAWF